MKIKKEIIMRVIFKKEWMQIDAKIKDYDSLKEDYNESRREIQELQNNAEERNRIITKIKEINEDCEKEILQLSKENGILKVENNSLKEKVKNLEKVIEMKNQENDLASIYDEYLYGPKKKG